MRISLRWLKDYVDVDASAAEVGERLTMAGLEVESVVRQGEHLQTVVCAKVLGSEKHPKADKLRLVTITDGKETQTVVCGAPNVPEPGGMVAWAKPGTRLPKGLVEARPVRGILSPGMLCSEEELDIGEDASGILILKDEVALGEPLFSFYGDDVLEVAVTTNRPDALGHVGIAREVAALFGLPLKRPATGLDPYFDTSSVEEHARVVLEDPVGCPRYTARVVRDVSVAPAPKWMQVRLRAVGIRPISNVVDITNFVLMEYGQPLHAFDLSRLAEKTIVVRKARQGERMLTLDGQERTFCTEDVLICDASKPVAVAGIMGGLESEVSPATRDVLIESANFAPTSIRRTSRRLGLATEASYRFERGLDPNVVDEASARAARLMAELCGGRVCRGIIDRYPKPVVPVTIDLRLSYARRLLGIHLSAQEAQRLLRSIDLHVEPKDEEVLTVRVPTFRPDLTREADLCEEIVRLSGLDAVPATIHPTSRAPQPSGDPVGECARDALAAAGLDEVITMGFTAPRKLALLLEPEEENAWRASKAWPERRRPVMVQNPLREDDAAMRTSLLPGLLDVVRLNLARGNTDVRVFEVGSVFFAKTEGALPDEPQVAAGVLTGAGDGWLKPGEPLDFYDAKGVVERLGAALGEKVRVEERSSLPFLHPGQAANVHFGERRVGYCGQVHPRVLKAFEIESPCYCFEVFLDGIALRVPHFREIPRYPAVVRDISFFIDEGIPAARIQAEITALGEPLCESVRLLEDYREKGRVPPGKKGMLWSVTYRAHDRTLTDEEANACRARLVRHLQERLGIEPR